MEGDGLRVEIVVGKADATEEPEALRQQGWVEEEITVAGEPAKSFTRPPTDKGPGLWRRVYFEHNGLAYEVSLNGSDEKQWEKAHKTFADILESIRWVN